jgi:hypothetical protein
MTLEEMLKELTPKVEKLHAMVKGPQEGIATWWLQLGKALDAVAQHAPSCQPADGKEIADAIREALYPAISRLGTAEDVVALLRKKGYLR